MQNEKLLNKKILLTGGGTGGSVSPLLAVAEEIYKSQITDQGFEFLWLGTKNGPEREMVENCNKPPSPCKGEGWGEVKFRAICHGKLRRYFSLRNFITPFFVLIGFFQTVFYILKWQPSLVMSAGSFVSVPVVWAAWLFGVPVLIHQQDARPGLANKLMAPFADKVTVTFKESLKHYGKKAVWIGNPVRQSLAENSEQKTVNSFKLNKKLPVVLVVGGGTGAGAINELVWKSLDKLTKFCQIIHITGKNKNQKSKIKNQKYSCYEFLEVEKMAEVLQVADVVVSRAGLGLLAELSYLEKPAILIPLPGSHQEDNARIFKEQKAAIVLDQKKLTARELTNNIKKLLDDEMLRNMLRNNIKKVIKKGANEKMVEIVKKVISNK